MCAVTIFSHKIISSVLLLFSVMSIAPLYNGCTVSDYIFESLGFSSWSEDGAHISVIPGVVLYFAALIWCAAAFRRTLPAAGLFLIFLSMGAASGISPATEYAAFSLKQFAPEKEAVEYLKHRSECSHLIERKRAGMSCTLYINHYGKGEQTISVTPDLSENIKDVTFKSKTFTVKPRSKTIIKTRFSGFYKGKAASDSGWSSEPELKVEILYTAD
ncbi:hypothetical protein ACO7RW_18945 [Bacillus amyloliquefaciens]|uniref:hypothetical protein n=1 Tax=Bacillus amyloliquefaciens group TaxID=1938374 RepID=UPI002945BB69|nr:hypothetical protein [Bacillus velezensis]MDV5129736.1 hypothetical protein [Bacillus velezensis]